MVARKAAVVSGLLVAALIVAAVLAWLNTPHNTLIPIHFDGRGQANGWARPGRAFALACIAPLMAWGVFAVLPYIDPRAQNLARSERAYGIAWIAVTLFTCISAANVLARPFGFSPPTVRLHVLLLGALLILLGNVMGKIRWNYTFGIRTPWTLADERVWDQTHRFGGWTFVAGGVALLIASLAFSTLPPLALLLLPTVLVISAAVILRSYLLWRSLHRG
jgi:uncharacterized membrane protein